MSDRKANRDRRDRKVKQELRELLAHLVPPETPDRLVPPVPTVRRVQQEK